MKETVKAPQSTTSRPKELSGQREPFFSPDKTSFFFNSPHIQPKLHVGKRGDPYEREADAMADKVVSRSFAPEALPSTKSGKEEERLSKKAEQNDEREHDIQREPFLKREREDTEPLKADEGEHIYRSANDLSTGTSQGESIVAIARSMIGKVKSKQSAGGDLRYGYDLLLEIFKVSAPGVWSEDVIKYMKYKLPSWCGIFATYCIKKAGINIGNWQMGKGVSAYGTLKQTSTPQSGDIGYIDKPFQHHCIVSKVDGDMIESIDGNSGWYGEIMENKRPKKAFTGFFTALHNASTAPVQKQEKDDAASPGQGNLESRLQSTKGQGTPMDNKTRNEMECGFGKDFSGVKLHTGGEATQLSNDLNAQAFTHGRDIYFNEGKYNPDSSSGKHLLAHELTHTVQQGQAPASEAQPGAPHSLRLAHQTAMGLSQLQRQDDPGTAPPTPVPAPACAFPVTLGHARGCGSGPDFGHFDKPSISMFSAAKLLAWAKIMHDKPSWWFVSDVACELDMLTELLLLGGSAGVTAFSRFALGMGGTVIHDETSMLGIMASFSYSFWRTRAQVQKDIEAQLAAQASSGVLNPCKLSVIPPETHFGFIDGSTLKAVIGGTQEETLMATYFAGDITKRSYVIDLIFEIGDDFGVDEDDLYSPGLCGFWVLQHERSRTLYAPFINKLVLPVTMKGTF